MLTILKHRRKSFRAAAAAGLVETFADDSANEYEWSKGTSSTYVGTLVTPTSSYTVTRLEFYLKKTGTGGGTITAEIWSATGSAGSETPDALLSTSTTIVSASSVSATKDWVSFYFDGQALVSGTKYFFVMKTPTTGDASNYYDLTLGSSNNTTNFETVRGEADGSGVGTTSQLTYSYWNTGTTTNPTTQSGFDAFFAGTPAGTGVHSTVINWDHNDSRGTKPTYLPANSYAWQVEGWINAATAGTYYFGTGSDDGNQLTIDGTIVTSFYGGRGIPGTVTSPNDTGSIYLTAGYHTFRYRMQEGSGGDGGYVAWKPPGDSSYVVTPVSVFALATTSWVSANGGRGGYCRSYSGDSSFATAGMTLDVTWETIGTAYSTLDEATSASAKVYCNFDKDDTGIIMEHGGSSYGLILYIHNETLYFQCGQGGDAGGDSNTGEVSYTVTNTTAQDFIIEWSADTSGCALYVDKTLIGTDVFSVSKLAGSDDGTIGQAYNAVPVNRGSSGSFTGTVTKAEIFLGEVTSDVSGL
jgi:hypothetical protein